MSEEITKLVELGPVPVIYADGIADAFIVGDNVRIVFFEYRRDAGGCGVKSPNLELIRPRHALCTADTGILRKLLYAGGH